MISIFKKTIKALVLLWLMPNLSLAEEIQYRPIPSMERQGFYVGGVLNNKFITEQENLFSSYSLKYNLFVPELNQLVIENYRNFFKISLAAGGHFFKKTFAKNKSQCQPLEPAQTLIYHGGIQGAFTYFEYFAPYVELGWARAHCFSYGEDKKISFKQAFAEFKSYISFGLFLSFKLADNTAIYSLDRDHGINDIGIVGQCSWFYRDKAEAASQTKKLSFCEAGLSFKL